MSKIRLDMVRELKGGGMIAVCRIEWVDRVEAYREPEFQKINQGNVCMSSKIMAPL
jgi:hypothetical protein